MGDNHYERYLAHRRATHPDEPVMTEREYWKARHDGTTVTARCC
ncbi:YbdD/YjiX family protein [Tsukamurella paurometabola]